MAKFDHRKTGEEADSMIRKLNQVGETDAENQEAAQPEAIVQDNANADDTGGEDPGTTDPGTQAPQDPQPATEQPNTEDPDLSEMNARLAKAEQRWNVLQGILNKKEEENAELRRLLANLAERQPTPPPTPETDQGAAAASGPAYTDEDVREFGQPLIDMVQRIATHAVKAGQSEMSRTFSEQVGTLERSVQDVAEETHAERSLRFDRRLRELVPDWEQINVDPLFVNDWLSHRDKFSGRTKLQLLQEAYSALDPERVAAFFLEYKGESAPAPQADQDPAPSKPNPASLVTPGRSKAAAAPKQSGEGRVWTRKDIAKLYDDKMKRRITAEEFDKQERDLFKAQSEGRVEAA